MNNKAKRPHKQKLDAGRQWRLRLRLKCVKLVQNGKSASEVARLHSLSPRAVSYWVTRFQLHGIEGLTDARIRSGRKSRLNRSQMKNVESFLKIFRKQSNPITGIILSTFLRDTFGLSYTVQQCRRIIKKLSA
jgi:transposase